MLNPVLITPPAGPAVELDTFRRHRRFTDEADPVLLQDALDAATAVFDGFDGKLQRALINQTWAQSYRNFQCLRLPLAPVQSIVSVTYFDRDGTEQTVAPSTYRLLATSPVAPEVTLAPATSGATPSWPSDLQSRDDAVTVLFVAGYGETPYDIPKDISRAILLLAGAWHENPEDTAIGVSVNRLPNGINFDSIVQRYKRFV